MTIQATTQPPNSMYNSMYNNPYAFMFNTTPMSNDFFGSQINWQQGLGYKPFAVQQTGLQQPLAGQRYFQQPIYQQNVFQLPQEQLLNLLKYQNDNMSINNIDILKEPKKSDLYNLDYIGNNNTIQLKYGTSQTFSDVYNLTKFMNEQNKKCNYLG